VFTRGYGKHPCVQTTRLQGLSVAPLQRYRCGRPHTQGFSFELRHTMELILARVFLHLLSDIIDLAGLSFQ
jgi:hypothetical protein